MGIHFMLIVKDPHKSWVDRVVDRISPEPPPPPPPSPPPLDQTAWERSVDSKKVNTLTVHDVGLIVLNETQSLPDNSESNDTIDATRQKVAHAVINADSRLGRKRPATAHPIEPSDRALKDPRTREAYDSSLRAAREAYLSPNDPTGGAIYFNMRPNSDRSNFRPEKAPPPGYKIKTQSGPFHNSYPTRKLPSRGVYVNTYGPD